MQQPGQPQPPKKLQDFNEELKNLCAKYQYELSAVEVPLYNPWGAVIGHRTTIQAFDISPKDQVPASTNENAAPQPEATPDAPAPIPPAPVAPTPAPTPETQNALFMPHALPAVPQPDPLANTQPVPNLPDTKKNDEAAQPNVNPNVPQSVPESQPSSDNTNQPADPANSIPGNDQPTS